VAVTRGEVAAQVTQHPDPDLSNSQADSASSILVTRSTIKRLVRNVITVPANAFGMHQGRRVPAACPMARQPSPARS
jgi:hypothetical protein